jgi:hypothetical protein
MPIFFRTFLSSSQNVAGPVPGFEPAYPLLLQESCQKPADSGKKSQSRNTAVKNAGPGGTGKAGGRFFPQKHEIP